MRLLKALILKESREEQGVARSAVGGWQSAGDLFARNLPPVNSLRSQICAAVLQFLQALRCPTRSAGIKPDISGWANVCRNGHFHRAHTHPGAMLSGVYYIQAGTRDAAHPAAGLLELIDPRPTPTELSALFQLGGQREVILPQTLHLVLFPSTLMHYVNTYVGDEPRISVGFNITIDWLASRRSL